MIEIEYTCQNCDHEFKMEVGYCDSRLDSVKPETCPECGLLTDDEAQIERRVEDKVAED